MTHTPLLAGSELTDGQRPGRIGLVVTRRGDTYIVTAARVYGDPLATRTDRLPACNLIVAQRSSALGGPCQPLRVAPPVSLLNSGVHRVTSNGTRAPGRVTALHGAVSAGPGKPIVTGTIEVDFLTNVERSRRVERMPTLAPSELGSLVMTYDGAAVGLIVAGEGYTAVVAPLSGFLELNQFELAESEFSDAWDVGLDSIYNDLNGVRLLNLGEMPEAA